MRWASPSHSCVSVFSPVATFTQNKGRLVVVKLGDMVQHKRDTGASTALATSACLADPLAPDLLQRVAAEDAATITALLAPGPRLRRVLGAPSFENGDVRAAWCAADAGGSSHAYIFGGGTGGAPNSRAAQSGQRTTASIGSSLSASSTVRYARQPRALADGSRPHSTHVRRSARSLFIGNENYSRMPPVVLATMSSP